MLIICRLEPLFILKMVFFIVIINGPAIIYSHSNNKINEWYLNGFKVEPMEVFDQMSEEDKEKAIWNLDEWK